MVSTNFWWTQMDSQQTIQRIEPFRVTRNGRRYFSREHKDAVVQACLMPGASVAGVSLAYGFNANLVRRWLVKHEQRLAAAGTTLVPVTVGIETRTVPEPAPENAEEPFVAPVSESHGGVIELEVQGVRLAVHGKVDQAALSQILQAMALGR